ncbi:sulfatase-like hydrolase/transferase [Streptomyces sp. B22F1]|uniref:sulfatase-like hydrolase/transferase n=1 Tax=Streptomyces sp. B22F1 TaxID=3153566 RepID=UPI00325CFDC0
MMPPNVVVVLADDLGIGDLGPSGSRLVRTLAMTRLAADGVVCEAMYAAAPTGTPSRAGLLTGRYGARYGLPASTAPGTDAGLPPDAVTVAKLLGSAGYATGLFGQGRLGAGPGRHPLDHGFGRFEGTLYGTDVMPLAWYEGRKAVVDDADPATAARRLTDAALDFVDDHRDGPFLAVLSHLGPHAPYRVEPRFHGASAAGAYGDLVEQLDHYLGVLLRHLDRRRLTRRTLVIVYCDDLGYGDPGCHGSPLVTTPVIDGMARRGMRLADFYAGAPTCTPSRASLLDRLLRAAREPRDRALPRPHQRAVVARDVAARLETVRGTVASPWRRQADGRTGMEVTVPYHTTAEVCIPVRGTAIRSLRSPLPAARDHPGGERYAVYRATAGTYRFTT